MSTVHGVEQYLEFKAIYPPTQGRIPMGCYSCKQDVQLDSGFVDITLPAYKGYLCRKCITIAIGSSKAFELLLWAQETYKQRSGQ